MHSNELFGGDVPESLKARIQALAQGPREALAPGLWAIQQREPGCLPVYYLLYKHHAGRRELQEAERAALLGLTQAGLAAGLPLDPAQALSLSRPPPQTDFARNDPARFWLFTLKALAFIRLRSQRPDEARSLLETIERLDPAHSVGSDVTVALLAGALTAPAGD